MTRRRKVQPARSSFGPEILSKAAFPRCVITKRPDRFPGPMGQRAATGKHLYGWIVLPANFSIVDLDGNPVILDAAGRYHEELGGDYVDAFQDAQEARNQCNRLNEATAVMES